MLTTGAAARFHICLTERRDYVEAADMETMRLPTGQTDDWMQDFIGHSHSLLFETLSYDRNSVLRIAIARDTQHAG